MSFIFRNRSLVALNALALSGCVAWAWFTWPKAVASNPAAASPPANASQQLLPTPQQLSTSAMKSRPLFNPSRRPAAVASSAAPAAPVPVAKPPLLIGLAGEEGQMGALFQDSAGLRSHLMLPGQSFAGWKLLAVRARSVRLQSAGSIVDVPLRPKAPSEPALAAQSNPAPK